MVLELVAAGLGVSIISERTCLPGNPHVVYREIDYECFLETNLAFCSDNISKIVQDFVGIARATLPLP